MMALVIIHRCIVCKEKEVAMRAFSGNRKRLICQECKETEKRIGKFLSEYNFVEDAK